MKKEIYFAIFAFGAVLLMNIIAANSTYCAERTKDGAWCQNVPIDKVDQNYRYVPTSCEATSYCKLGTCVNKQEGICMENTPEKLCQQPSDGTVGGVWFDSNVDKVPQCQLGCCLLGDQAAFVTQTRCSQLSSLYGLQTNYKTNINNEAQCIASATSSVKGACVFEKDFQRTCRFISQSDCSKISSTNSGNSSVEFHEGFLCSAEELATNCGPSEKTTVVDGRDEVYFVDTCGNLANIYDANRKTDQPYWTKVIGKANSCGYNDKNGNANSATCGNCDYYLGSTGKAYDRSIDSQSPRFGNYICRDLSCKYQEKNYKHGESWCVSSDNGKNLPGSRYFRQVCYNGQVTTEACADFRQETCIQDSVNNFKTAACRVNEWQDCSAQSSQKDCENTDQRDCSWNNNQCVPKNAPGFDFWKSTGNATATGNAQQLCALGNSKCVAKFEKGLTGGWTCKENCDCLGGNWAQEQNRMCIALGDCGSNVNFIGQQGFHDINNLITKPEE